jgi:hypothetical protein
MAGEWDGFQEITARPLAEGTGSAGGWDHFEPVQVGSGDAAKEDTKGKEGEESAKAAPLSAATEETLGTLPHIPGGRQLEAAARGTLGPLTEAAVPMAEAGIGALGGYGKGGSIGERYHNLLPALKEAAGKWREEHPYQSFAARTAGMVGASALGPVRGILGLTAGSVPKMAARGAASGAGLSAGGALLEGQDPEAAAKEGALYGALGGAAGGVAQRALGGGATVARGLASGTQEDVRAAATQRTAGALDPGGRVLAPTAEEGAEQAASALRQGQAQAQAGVSQRYTNLGNADAHLAPSLFRNVAPDIEANLMSPGALRANPPTYLDVHRDITPGAQPVWDAIKGAEQFMQQMSSKIKIGAVSQSRVDFGGIVAYDKRISSLVDRVFSSPSSTGQDRYAAQTLKNAWRDWINNTVNKPGVIQGPDRSAVVGMWNDARAAHAEMSAAYRPRGDAGPAMGTILGRPARGQTPGTPADVASALFDKRGTSESLATINHIRSTLNTLPNGADAWTALRQGMIQRLMQGEPQQVVKNLQSFLGPGSPLAQQMFNPTELAGLRLLHQGSQAMTERPGAGRMLMRQGFRILLPLIGLAHHNPFGVVAGFMGHHGINAFTEAGASGRVARAFAGTRPPSGKAARLGAAAVRGQQP